MHNPLLTRFAAMPALVAPELRDRFEGCLAALSSDQHAAEILSGRAATASTDDGFWPAPNDWRAAYRPYVVTNGILQIPVRGVLLHNFPFAFGDWATGYDYIWRAFERGLADGNVRGIALVIDSPGGEVAGNFDLVDRMFERRGEKPVRAFAHESAYSAAYSIASVADRIVVSRTGGVGSIGVVTSHMDVSRALENAGYQITFIHAGKHKVDGNPYQPLPEDVKTRIQTRIDALYAVFVSTVARNRGLDEQAVRDTEALTYGADEAIGVGLADEIGSLEVAFAAFEGDLEDGFDDNDGDEEMDKIHTAEELAQASATARTDEKNRIKAIVESDAGKSRAAAAFNLAMNTDMTVEQATSLLLTLPEDKKPEAAQTEEKPGAAGKIFDAAMNNSGNPNLGAGADGGEQAEQTDSDRILANFAAASGYKARKSA